MSPDSKTCNGEDSMENKNYDETIQHLQDEVSRLSSLVKRSQRILEERKRKAMMRGEWETSHALSMAAQEIFGESI